MTIRDAWNLTNNIYLDQKHTPDLFLERGAISQEQYDKSLGDLTKKMGMDKPE